MADRNDTTHDPTSTRLRQAETSGQFARSRELAVAITWLGGVALLMTFGSQLWKSLETFSHRCWSRSDLTLSAKEELGSSTTAAASIFWTGLLPILAGVGVIAVMAWSAQSGFRFYPHLVLPDVNRINPVRNLTRSFSSENGLSVVLGLVKFAVLMAIAVWILAGDADTLIRFSAGPLSVQGPAISEWIGGVVLRLCVAAVAVGVVDYGIRWQLNRRSLRMTDQQVRDEQRSMEPSPEVGARRRLMQQR